MVASGKYTKGGGKAHLANYAHESIFGFPMFGTFNVRTKINIEKFAPIITSPETGARYYHIRINGRYDAWVWRRNGTKMPGTVWELISKELLPNELKRGMINIEILEAN